MILLYRIDIGPQLSLRVVLGQADIATSLAYTRAYTFSYHHDTVLAYRWAYLSSS